MRNGPQFSDQKACKVFRVPQGAREQWHYESDKEEATHGDFQGDRGGAARGQGPQRASHGGGIWSSFATPVQIGKIADILTLGVHIPKRQHYLTNIFVAHSPTVTGAPSSFTTPEVAGLKRLVRMMARSFSSSLASDFINAR